MIYEHEFMNKRPSIVMIKAKIKEAIKLGADYITLDWGENQIRLEKANGRWWGGGWLGRGRGGQDIANGMNKETK